MMFTQQELDFILTSIDSRQSRTTQDAAIKGALLCKLATAIDRVVAEQKSEDKEDGKADS